MLVNQPSSRQSLKARLRRATFFIWVSIWIFAGMVVLGISTPVHAQTTDGWIVQDSGTNTILHDVWGTDVNDVWAVGGNPQSGGGGIGTILKWDGVNWHTQAQGISPALFGVGGADTENVWAVGVLGTILKWNGRSWTSQDSGTDELLIGVWGTDRDNVWVVGDRGTILKWNGRSWTSQDSGTDEFLTGIWGTDRDNVWVVGHRGTILKWNGRSWTSQISGTDDNIHDVWGSDQDNVWVVSSTPGDIGYVGGILKWDGNTWRLQESDIPSEMIGVWAANSGNVWAVGDSGTILKSEPIDQHEGNDIVLVVHGWQGIGTANYECNEYESRLGPGPYTYKELKDNGLSVPLGHLGDMLNEEEFDVFYAFWDTTPFSTPTIEQNGQCLAAQIARLIRERPNADRITVVAHSMGGLVTRSCIAQSVSCRESIETVITLGTPHQGVPAATLAYLQFSNLTSTGAFCRAHPGVCQFTESRIAQFNRTSPNWPGISYLFIGGDGGIGTTDGFVGRLSAIGEGAGTENGWLQSNHPQQYYTDETHSPQFLYHPYYNRRNGSLSHSMVCILFELGHSGATKPSECRDVTQIAAASLEDESLELALHGPYATEISANDTNTHVVILDRTSDAVFSLTTDDPWVFLILDYAGTEITPQVALDSETSDFSLTDQGDGTFRQTYLIKDAAVGQWAMKVVSREEATEPAGYSVSALTEATGRMELTTDRSQYAPGEEVQISLTLADMALENLTFTADAQLPDGSTLDLTLSEDQPNTYRATFTASNAPGVALVTVQLNGSSSGVEQMRFAAVTFDVNPRAASLEGVAGHEAVDTDGDDSTDEIHVNTRVSVQQAGEYGVIMHLYAGDTFVDTAQTTEFLESGQQEVALVFDAETLIASGANVFTVHQLYLNMITPSGPLAVGEWEHDYEFGVPSKATLESIAGHELVDINGDGQPDQIQVDLRILVQQSDEYNITMDLFSDNMLVATAETTMFLGVGMNSVKVPFDIEALAESGATTFTIAKVFLNTVTEIGTVLTDESVPDYTFEYDFLSSTEIPAFTVVLRQTPKTWVAPGDRITYEIAYAGNGANTRTNLTIAAQVPDNVELILDSVTGTDGTNINISGTEPGSTIFWSWDNLPADAAGTVSYQVMRLIWPMPPVPLAMSISKAGPENSAPGQEILYTLTITNNAPVDITGIVVQDRVPMGATYVRGGIEAEGIVSWQIGDMSPFTTTKVDYVVTAQRTIVNSDYEVIANGGVQVKGLRTVVTEINGTPPPAGGDGLVVINPGVIASWTSINGFMNSVSNKVRNPDTNVYLPHVE